MAREEYNPDSASSQVFWLLFESDLTPAGKNLLDGRYACFGYTVEVRNSHKTGPVASVSLLTRLCFAS